MRKNRIYKIIPILLLVFIASTAFAPVIIKSDLKGKYLLLLPSKDGTADKIINDNFRPKGGLLDPMTISQVKHLWSFTNTLMSVKQPEGKPLKMYLYYVMECNNKVLYRAANGDLSMVDKKYLKNAEDKFAEENTTTNWNQLRKFNFYFKAVGPNIKLFASNSKGAPTVEVKTAKGYKGTPLKLLMVENY